ncbi:peptidylprolyl isomerase [Shimia sediminis]|uniref:peptidylprolyl isomerase n=1 Tax=Shimia sediminis TaxID=2497945 RepID=UPI000F8CE2FE|nr:peptidylprolyl isomerase [Shimia sediminis]
MSKHLRIFRSVAVAAMLCGPAIAQEAPTATSVMATVNGVEITLGQMILVRDALPDQYKSLPDDVLFNGILDQIVQQTVLSQSLTGDEPAAIAMALENEHRLLRAGEAINQILEAGVPEDAVNAAYEAQYVTGYSGPTEYNASHILVEEEEKAIALRTILLDGADFAETAKVESTGPSGPSGGLLGWFGPGEMVPAFEQAVSTLDVGQISEPVKTQFGWHLIILNDSRVRAAPALDEVRTQLVNELQQQLVDEEIARLTETADVDRSTAEAVDPALLKQTGLLDAWTEGN